MANQNRNAEREYQSRIQTLQKEMEVEREKWNQQTAKQIQKMESSMGQQRYEEQNLKDKLADSEEVILSASQLIRYIIYISYGYVTDSRINS